MARRGMTISGMVVEIVLVVVAAVLLLLALVALRRLQQLRRGGVDVALRRALPVDATSPEPHPPWPTTSGAGTPASRATAATSSAGTG